MGNNNCIGSRVSRDGIFQTISSSVWWARSKDCLITYNKKENVDGLSLNCKNLLSMLKTSLRSK
jgi:calcium-dependent protein kinase